MTRVTDQEWLQLLRRYHMETENHDLGVCTGPWNGEGILPANQKEAGVCAAFAAKLRKTMMLQYGLSPSMWRWANKQYLESVGYWDDMQTVLRIYKAVYPEFRPHVTEK